MRSAGNSGAAPAPTDPPGTVSLAVTTGADEAPPAFSVDAVALRLRQTLLDDATGLHTFVGARPNFLLDLSRCTRPSAAPKVNLASAVHGGTVRALHAQQGFPAAAAIDDVTDDSTNGWAFHGNIPLATLVAHIRGDAADGVSRVVLVSGVGLQDHHLTSFRLEQQPGCARDSWEVNRTQIHNTVFCYLQVPIFHPRLTIAVPQHMWLRLNLFPCEI